jgi:glycosyltransferase involved in cell wall biosynthesis
LALRRLGANAQQVPIGSNIRPICLNDAAIGSIRSRYHIPTDYTLLGHFGTTIGLDTVFRALPSLKKTSLLLIGKRNEIGSHGEIDRVPKDLHTLLEMTGCSHRVRWTSHLSAEEVSHALAACDVVALPYPAGASLRHGGLIAAICQGRAIVTTTPQTPLGKLLAQQIFLTVPPGDPSALAAAVRKISSDNATKTNLEAAAVAVRGYFSWDSIAREHLSWYQTRGIGVAR